MWGTCRRARPRTDEPCEAQSTSVAPNLPALLHVVRARFKSWFPGSAWESIPSGALPLNPPYFTMIMEA
jgi:hypothetical protein